MENRELTDEENAIVYTDNTHIKYNEILSRPEIVDEIRKAYIAGLKEERERIGEKLNQIDNICDMVLDGATNWDEEQLEGFIKQIKKIMN